MRLYSIIIAVYNVEKYLGECLDSIIDQSYPNWEAILVDDGSADRSPVICDAYAAKDKRIKVVHKSNEGSLMARRFGIYQAAGDYFLFIDSDDMLNCNLLNDVDQIIDRTGSDLVIYRFQRYGGLRKSKSPIVFQEGTIIGEGGKPKKLIWDKVISGCGLNSLCLKVAKRECIDFENDYEKYAFLKFGTDLMQSLAILDRADKICFTEKVYYYYRFNENGISGSKTHGTDIKNIKMLLRTRKTLFERILYYLKKNNYDSRENLEKFYIYYYKNVMRSLITWISNEKKNALRQEIIQMVMGDELLKESIQYIEMSHMPKRYRQLYKAYRNKDAKKFTACVCCHAGKKRFVEWCIQFLKIVRRK